MVAVEMGLVILEPQEMELTIRAAAVAVLGQDKLLATAALVLSSSKSQTRIAQSFHRVWTSVTTLQTLTTHNP
jgi:hypothetical protein